MNRLLKFTLAAAFLVTGISMLPGCNGASDAALNLVDNNKGAERGFMIRSLTHGDHTRKYGLFVPTTYNPANRYPAIIFLHGVGEGGSDSRANLRVGLAPFVAARSADFPFICIFPQSPDGNWHAESQAASDVIAELDEVSKKYSIDQDRVSLTGLSTGGYGTWAIGAKYKDRFAALVPMGSSEDPSKFAKDLVNMPIRSFHNGSDIFAASWNDSSMVEKIKSLGGRNVEFTLTSDAGHDCWDGVYSQGELFAWLQQQRRSHSSSSLNSPSRSTAGLTASQAVPARSNASAVVNTPY